MNDKGSILIITLLMTAILSIIGMSASTIAQTDINISNSFKTDKEAFYIAEAGLEHAREILRSTIGKNTFTEKLKDASGVNNKLEGTLFKSDDIPILDSDFAYGNYKVYLMNDMLDGPENVIDTNMQITLISLGVVKTGGRSLIEMTLKKRQVSELPALITIIGKGSFFKGNQNLSKLLTSRGNKGCRNQLKPVFAISNEEERVTFQKAVNESIPETYITDHIYGPVQKNSESNYFELGNNLSIDFNNVESLKGFMNNISKGADTLIRKSGDSKNIDMGSGSHPKIVVAEKNFDLKKDGSGVLLVKGDLNVRGSVNYNGLIMVVGSGKMKIYGKGKGRIEGGIIISNINYPAPGVDGELFTIDDEPGPALFDISETEDINISLCSKNVSNGFSLLPLASTAYFQEL